MNTNWYDYCDNGFAITKHYDVPPPLEDVVVTELDGSAYFDQYSFRLWLDLPTAPKSLPDGSQLCFSLYFMELEELRLSTTSLGRLTTTLTVSRSENGRIHVTGTGEFNIYLVCKSFMVEDKLLSNSHERARRVRNLGSYYQTWNACLIELLELGYELSMCGPPDADGSTGECSFTATKNFVRLGGRNPVELLGLAALHARFPEFDHASEVWQRPGPNVIHQLTQDWENRWCKPKS